MVIIQIGKYISFSVLQIMLQTLAQIFEQVHTKIHNYFFYLYILSNWLNLKVR